MTDLFQQFGGALADFKMRNIDSDSLHEIIGEFAPLIGVPTDALPKKQPPIKVEPLAPVDDRIKSESVYSNSVTVPAKRLKLDVKVEKVETSPESSYNSTTVLDLSLKHVEDKKPALHSIGNSIPLNLFLNKHSIVNYDIVTGKGVSLINQSVYKKSQHSIDTAGRSSSNCADFTLPSNKLVICEENEAQGDSTDEDSKSGDKLQYEIKTVNNLKYYHCKLCPKVYDTKYLLNRHLITHGGNRPHSCDQCNKTFSQKCDLNRHMSVHNGCRQYACSVCGKSFKRSDYLAKHERMYCGVMKPHKCQKCHKGFEEQDMLLDHTCTGRTDGTFDCEHCSSSFTSVDALVEHRKGHLKIEQEYKCSRCMEKYTDFMSYVEHFKKHSSERPYTCDLCQKVFSRNHNLMTHMWIHNQEKQHTCQICAKTFTYYSNLQVHLRVHRNERPYICEECDKGFLTSSDLRRHKRTHSGEKPYKCEHCPCEYARKERLISHMLTHMEDGGTESRESSASIIADDTSNNSTTLQDTSAC